MFLANLRVATLALLPLLAVRQARAAEGPERPGDLHPLAPLSQMRLSEFRNYGSGSDGSFVFAPDCQSLLVANNNALLLYDLTKARQPPARQPRQIMIENAYFSNTPVVFAPDGKTVVAAAARHFEDASVRFWDITTGKELRQLDNDQEFYSLAVSPDGKMLALGTQQRVEVWDAVTGDELRVMQGKENSQFRVLAFSPDGRMLATAGLEPHIQLWEVATGKERADFRLGLEAPPQDLRYYRGHDQQPISVLAFSNDSQTLAVAAADHAIHVLDLATGQELPPLVGHLSAIRALRFTPDGRRLVSFDGEGMKLVWDAGRLARVARERLPQLSPTEFEKLWADLLDGDAFRTYRAARYLADDPRRGMSFLKEHLQAVPVVEPKHLEKLIADLQNENAAVRRKAMTELRTHGEAALGALSLPVEGRRGHRAVEMMVRKLEVQYATPERARSLKALHMLEQIGTADARQLLETLARGAAGTKLTVEARAAANRLAKQKDSGS